MNIKIVLNLGALKTPRTLDIQSRVWVVSTRSTIRLGARFTSVDTLSSTDEPLFHKRNPALFILLHCQVSLLFIFPIFKYWCTIIPQSKPCFIHIATLSSAFIIYFSHFQVLVYHYSTQQALFYSYCYTVKCPYYLFFPFSSTRVPLFHKESPVLSILLHCQVSLLCIFPTFKY